MGADGVAAAVFANSVVQSLLLGLVLLGLMREKTADPPREAQEAP
jgi:hypothetical protein